MARLPAFALILTPARVDAMSASAIVLALPGETPSRRASHGAGNHLVSTEASEECTRGGEKLLSRSAIIIERA